MRFRDFFYRYKFPHFLFWIILFCGWFYFRYQDFASNNTAVIITAIKVVDLAIMVYVTNYILIPALLYKKKYFLFGICFFVMIITSSVFKMYFLSQIIYPSSSFDLFDQNFKTRIYDNVIPHFLLVITGAAFKLLLDFAKAQRRIGEMAKEKAEAELIWLKSQMNPHFLFNALNSVYFLIDKQNAAARQALHTFSGMLRYQLYEIKDEKVPIEKEINYLKDYIEVQGLRRENLSVQINIDEDLKGFNIEPLLLIPFIENSFKHLSHFGSNNKNEINIHLYKQKDEMIFTVLNTTESKEEAVLKQNGGIGLSNVKRRLALLYPQTHQLTIQHNNGHFDVQLKLKIE